MLLSLMSAHGAFEPMEKMPPSCGGGGGGGIEVLLLLLVFVGGAAWTVVTIEVVPLPAVLASS